MQVDLTGADVVTLYLATQLNEQLRPRLEKFLKPGARVVSHDYKVPGWKATKVDRTDGGGAHVIYLYEMPPVKDGDFLAILDVGAYGMVLASNYNTRPRPAEVLVDGSKARLIRRREKVSDLLRQEKA